jgi:outer membrane lipoprotein-sorting protein
VRSLKRALTCVLLFCAAGVSLPASQSSDPLDELFRRARPVQAALRTLTASFTETSVSTLLREPVVATGTLVASMPLRVVMEYKRPTPKTVALDQRWMVIAWPNRTEFEKVDIVETQRRVQKYFVDVSPKQLRDSFAVTLTSERSMGDAYRLDLVPKRKQISEGVARIQIWIDRETLMMTKMALSFAGGDAKTLELRDVRMNPAIDESAFALLTRAGR